MSQSGTYKVIHSLVDKQFLVTRKEQGAIAFAAVPLAHIARKLKGKGRTYLRLSGQIQEMSTLLARPPETDVLGGNDLTDYYVNIPYSIDDFIWCVGSFEAVMCFFGRDIEQEFIRTRMKKGKHADAVIFDDSLFSKELAGRDPGEKRETRLVPHARYPLTFSYLFGNTCLDFYQDANQEVKVLKTESPALARARLIQYQSLWNSTVS